MKQKNKNLEYRLIRKSIFFLEQEILAIGDLHLGYETMLHNEGIFLDFNQLENTKKEIKEIIGEINSLGYSIKKIIFLGDIKHNFGFEKKEVYEIREFLNFLEKYFLKKDIIFIRGNHDQIKINEKDYLDYYLLPDKKIAFIHGDKTFPEIFDKNIETIVMSHIHPAVILKDSFGIKKEKFKAFLIGKWKNKNLIILPSFFPIIEGTEIDELEDYKRNKSFSIITNKDLMKFDVYIIGDKIVHEFGKFKDL